MAFIDAIVDLETILVTVPYTARLKRNRKFGQANPIILAILGRKRHFRADFGHFSMKNRDFRHENRHFQEKFSRKERKGRQAA